jgi:glyoxylase-like metal-dependent hydrolase (beta-lactamase superfamily II)
MPRQAPVVDAPITCCHEKVNTVRPGLDCVVTTDGQRNVWFVGDGAECVVIDPAGAVGELLGHCDSRRLRAILWTNLWPESVATAISLADHTGAVTYLHEEDLVIWRQVEPERRPQSSVPQGLVLKVGGIRLESIHTPGISLGALCWHAPLLSAVFTGETLKSQGPGGTDLSASDRSRLMASIRVGLFTLPSQTVVHPGRGVDTRIGTQRWDRRFWS